MNPLNFAAITTAMSGANRQGNDLVSFIGRELTGWRRRLAYGNSQLSAYLM